MYNYLKNEKGEIPFVCSCCGELSARKRFYDIVTSNKCCVACADRAKNKRYKDKK